MMVYTKRKGEFVPGIEETRNSFEDADDSVIDETAGAIPDFIDRIGGFKKKKQEDDRPSPFNSTRGSAAIWAIGILLVVILIVAIIGFGFVSVNV